MLVDSVYQENSSENDINQSTLVFNFDPSNSNDELREIFGAYGEIKEVIFLASLVANTSV